MDTRFGYTFPAVRGLQAHRQYYASMCPLRLIPKLFLYDEEEAELSPELKAQRTLNLRRIPEITNYILDNPDDYSFSAITASIDGNVDFDPLGEDPNSARIGMLHVPMDAKFIINDGQHRRAAIEEALKENPELGDESIAVVFFVDRGLERCQQMFADLNRYAVRTNKSLGILYDHRDDMAHLSRLVVLKSEIFRDLVEMGKSTLSKGSRKLFTLSAIHSATKALVQGMDFESQEKAAEEIIAFWEEVAKQIPEWELVRKNKMLSAEVRASFLHSSGIMLHAIGRVGNQLLKKNPNDWKTKLSGLQKADWSRTNTQMWEGRAMISGRLSKSNQCVLLTASAIKDLLGIPLMPEERDAEQKKALSASKNGR